MQRNAEDREADRQDLHADFADAAANARDLDADLRDGSAEAGDRAAAEQNHGLLSGGRRRARSDRKAAAGDRGQAGDDRDRARSDRGASRQARANAAQDRAVATDVETDLVERLIKAEDSAADMLLIGEAQGVLMATRSLDAIDAAAELCAQAARDKRKLNDVASSIITEAGRPALTLADGVMSMANAAFTEVSPTMLEEGRQWWTCSDCACLVGPGQSAQILHLTWHRDVVTNRDRIDPLSER